MITNPLLGWITAICFASVFLVSLCWLLSVVCRSESRHFSEKLTLTGQLAAVQIELESIKADRVINPARGRRPSRNTDVYSNLNHAQLYLEKFLVNQSTKLDRILGIVNRVSSGMIENDDAAIKEMGEALAVVATQLTAEMAAANEAYSRLVDDSRRSANSFVQEKEAG
jgi:hypothetical protein